MRHGGAKVKNAIRCTMSIYGLEVGGTAGKHGVGVLLHNRWSNYVHRWRAISPRHGVLELNVKQLKMSLFICLTVVTGTSMLRKCMLNFRPSFRKLVLGNVLLWYLVTGTRKSNLWVSIVRNMMSLASMRMQLGIATVNS